jgi:hypothetical protein
VAPSAASRSRFHIARPGALRLLGAAAALAACTSNPPTGQVAQGYEGAPGVEGFLLCPMNLAIALPAELEDGIEPVQEAIVAYVQQHGRRVDRLSLPEARDLWEHAIETAKAVEPLRFETAATAFVAGAAAQHHDFGALLLPSLIVQRAVVRHRGVAWDGVQRRIRVVNRPHEPAGRNQNALIEGMAMGDVNANVSIISLHLLAFSREGKLVFQGRGGVDIAEEVDLQNAEKTFRFQIRVRSDVFEDRRIVREAVAIAFEPYLPALSH